jgi:signal transduction histidine kinase
MLALGGDGPRIVTAPDNARTSDQPSGTARGRDIGIAGAIGIGLTAVAAIVTASGGLSPHPGLAALGRTTTVAVPIAVGLYAWRRRPYERFGRMLFAFGVVVSLTALAGWNAAVPYSVGRVAGWLTELTFIWVILAFPSGRLRGRSDRALVMSALLLVLVGYLPTALLVERYATPSTWTECRADCPSNAFQIVDHEPGFVVHGLPAVRETLTVLVFLAVAAVLARRVRSATRLTRLMLTPVLAVAAARLVVYATGVATRRADPTSPIIDDLAWIVALLVPTMAVAFLIGLLRWQLFTARALQRLAHELHTHLDAEHLRAALAAILEDPSLRLAFWSREGAGGWVDGAGDRVDLTAIGPGRSVTTVHDSTERVAAIIHDSALRDQPEFVKAAATFGAIALDNHRLVVQVRSSLREVQESRARILATADEERRRIERDLHDGAQQRLVALRIKLELAEELVMQDPRRGRELLHEIGDETEEALEDVRSLAHGVYPALLTRRGLADALRDAALRSPITVELDAGGIGRYPAEVESAVYFCCLEAMQNAFKHAADASLITIVLTNDGELSFEVIDDGAGFDARTTPPGDGLANMRDRLAAVGGELTVLSARGTGTRVIGVIPSGPA